MFKQIYKAMTCLLSGHDYQETSILRENLVVEEVCVNGNKITVLVEVEAEHKRMKTCDVCTHRDFILQAIVRNKITLVLDLPYLAGLYSEGLVEKAEILLHNLLFFPASASLEKDFAPVIVSANAELQDWHRSNRQLVEMSDGRTGWGPVAGQDVLAYRDGLLLTNRNLDVIDQAVKNYLSTIGAQA